ncbi:hypothetical protein ACLOJK_036177 [Asimina triloba]
MDQEPTAGTPLKEIHLYRSHFPGAVRQKAYIFDGLGNYFTKEWDLAEGRGNEFCWYHVELPKGNQKLSLSAQYLIDVLCPPLKLQDILALVTNGPFCGYVNGALIFRVNSPGHAPNKFTLRLAARVTENSIITVSLGRIPRLGFSPSGQSLLSDIPSIEHPNLVRGNEKDSGTVIKEHVLEFLLTMNHSEGADNPVPRTIGNLLVHIIDTHMDHLQDIVTELEMELDTVELEMDNGGFAAKKEMLDDRRFPKMHLNLQRLLQVFLRHPALVALWGITDIPEPHLLEGSFSDTNCNTFGSEGKLYFNSGYPEDKLNFNSNCLEDNTYESYNVVAHAEQVFPRVKEKCAAKGWLANEDIISLEEMIGHLRRLKENMGFLDSRVTAIQAGLDSWQAEQINRRLYYLSFLSMIFLPLSVITGVFGMNVGGVPWTTQRDPSVKDGFWNVLLLCGAMLLFLVAVNQNLYTVNLCLKWDLRMDAKEKKSTLWLIAGDSGSSGKHQLNASIAKPGYTCFQPHFQN